MSESSIQISKTHGVAIIDFSDNSILDTLTIQRIGRELYQVVEQPLAQQVIIDFQHVRFLSSQALGVMVTLRRKADKSGVEIALVGLRPELARVFQLTKLDKMFEFFDTQEEALAHFGEKP